MGRNMAYWLINTTRAGQFDTGQLRGALAGVSGMILLMSWETLGDEVRKRRKSLRLTQADVTARGGPSVETLRAVENNRARRLSSQSRRALERAIEWEPGSINDVVTGAPPRLAGKTTCGDQPSVTQSSAITTTDYLAMAQHVATMKQAFARHRDSLTGPANQTLQQEITLSARETEKSIIKILPHLDDEDRGTAIHILTELRGE